MNEQDWEQAESWELTVSLDTLTSSSALKSPPMFPFWPGAVGTGTAFPPADSSNTLGRGAAIMAFVVIKRPAKKYSFSDILLNGETGLSVPDVLQDSVLTAESS